MEKRANNMPCEPESDLPLYEQSDSNTAPAYSVEERSEDTASQPNTRPKSQNKQASYALSLQRACDFALQRVKNNNVIANTNWAAPLATAPCAISTMAILLKAAAKDAAAGLEIESQDVKNMDGTTVVGNLPSKSFRTNLQHCSDIGRLAFLDAQHGMSTIRATVSGMISEQGNIGYIIDLLENPEDARYNLKSEIGALKKMAKKCLVTTTAITEKFEYWYLVILHLKKTSLTQEGEVKKNKDATVTKKTHASQDELRYQENKLALEKKIKMVQEKLDRAKRDVDRSQTEVDRLQHEPIVSEPSALEEMAKVRETIRLTPPPVKDRGLLWDIKNLLWGPSKEEEEEDEANRKAHSLRETGMQDEALRQAREQRDYQRKLAAERLESARDMENKTAAELNTIYSELNTSNYQLGEAKANLEKTKAEFQLLCNKEIELDEIITILDNSTKNLSKLKEQIEPLVDFFKSILVDIDGNVDVNLEAFLGPIVNGIKEGSNPDEIKCIHLSRNSKERIMSTALQMQGRFSAIADISTAYITVSMDYIRPAINEMEMLSTMTDSEWQIKSQDFIHKCDRLMTDIDSFAQKTNANVDVNVGNYINALQRRAIEAASKHEQNELS